jgi:hypothetical protein
VARTFHLDFASLGGKLVCVRVLGKGAAEAPYLEASLAPLPNVVVTREQLASWRAVRAGVQVRPGLALCSLARVAQQEFLVSGCN